MEHLEGQSCFLLERAKCLVRKTDKRIQLQMLLESYKMSKTKTTEKLIRNFFLLIKGFILFRYSIYLMI